MTMAVLNGELVPAQAATLAVQDAGIVFGATVTDYCRTFGQRLFRYPLHMERLRRDCAACFVPLLIDDTRLIELADALVRHNAAPGDELALITFATPGPLASLGGEGGPTLVMHTFPISKVRYRSFFAEGVKLAPVEGEPVFPTAKHRSRLHWWRTAHLVPAGELALLVADGTITETAIGNVLRVNGSMITASPASLVLDGIAQSVTREAWRGPSFDVWPGSGFGDPGEAPCVPSLPEPGFQSEPRPHEKAKAPAPGMTLLWREAASTVADCLAADEVLLTGSAFGVAPVSRIGGQDRAWGGPVYQRLQKAWDEAVGVVIPEQFLRS